MVNKNRNVAVLILLTPLFFLITHAIAYLAHEYSHSFSAWAFGYKQNPLALDYGDASLSNILLLQQVSENVDYDTFKISHPWIAAFVAFAGFGVGNVILYFVSAMALLKGAVKNSIYFYFFLWLAVMNLGNFIAYVPARTFATHGDIGGIISFLTISPWWIMILIGYPIFYCVWHFYSRILPHTYAMLSANRLSQMIILVLLTLTLFVFFGTSGLQNYGENAHLISLLSLYITPIIIVACWPWRYWIKAQVLLNQDK